MTVTYAKRASSISSSVKGKKANVDKRASTMVIVLCTLSSLEHFFLIFTTIYVLNTTSEIGYYFNAGANLSMAIKHSANFFVFFYFNRNFRKKFIEKVKILNPLKNS